MVDPILGESGNKSIIAEKMVKLSHHALHNRAPALRRGAI